MRLSAADKSVLLSIARESIRRAVSGKEPAPVREISATLRQPAGVFVTLELHHELRGCIGYIEPVLPLVDATREVAAKAAVEDPRFDPVTPADLQDIEIEVSVLSPLHEIRSPEEVTVGLHGLVLESGFRRGLLLPQVATDYGWDRYEFLSHTARKAGLPADAWKRPGAKLFTFTVERFTEHEQAEHSDHRP